MNAEQESVFIVSDETDGGNVVAMIKRDPVSRKNVIYLVTEATPEDIARLISSNAPHN